MTDTQRDALLVRMSQDVAEIKVKLEVDYRALHGNGHPGLIQNHSDLDKRVQTLEDQHKSESKHHGAIAVVIAFIINAAIAIYAAFKNS